MIKKNLKKLLPTSLARTNNNCLVGFIDSHIIHYPAPLTALTYAWSFGSLTGLRLLKQNRLLTNFLFLLFISVTIFFNDFSLSSATCLAEPQPGVSHQIKFQDRPTFCVTDFLTENKGCCIVIAAGIVAATGIYYYFKSSSNNAKGGTGTAADNTTTTTIESLPGENLGEVTKSPSNDSSCEITSESTTNQNVVLEKNGEKEAVESLSDNLLDKDSSTSFEFPEKDLKEIKNNKKKNKKSIFDSDFFKTMNKVALHEGSYILAVFLGLVGGACLAIVQIVWEWWKWR
jgi:hypothetical protein